MLSGVQGMVGETALVTRAVGDAHHPGRVRARGEEWQAISLDPDEVVPVGARAWWWRESSGDCSWSTPSRV